MVLPETRYARSGELAIAYQVHGAGDVDLLFSGSTASNVETAWLLPEAAQLFERLGRFARVIRFDRRDSGCSDPYVDDLTLEAHADDALAVMDAVGADRPVLLGALDGGRSLAALAATRPEAILYTGVGDANAGSLLAALARALPQARLFGSSALAMAAPTPAGLPDVDLLTPLLRPAAYGPRARLVLKATAANDGSTSEAKGDIADCYFLGDPPTTNGWNWHCLHYGDAGLSVDRTVSGCIFDPIRLTVQHDAFTREHIDEAMSRHAAVDVMDPDITLTDVVNAMEDAGTVDLRCDSVLPWGLRVLGTQSDPALRDAI